jgi:AcrR family transcriptional regulator
MIFTFAADISPDAIRHLIRVSLKATTARKESSPTPSADRRARDELISLRQRGKATRRAAILKAARAIFSEEGYEAASITGIARLAGVADGTIYRHFANKRDLLYHVMRVFYERIIADVEQEVARTDSFAEQLFRLIRGHLAVFAEEVDLCRLFIREVRSADDYYDSLMYGLNRRYTSILLDILTDARARGEMDSGIDPRMVRDLVYGAIEHLSWRMVNRQSVLRAEAVAQQLSQIVLSGIETRRERTRYGRL